MDSLLQAQYLAWNLLVKNINESLIWFLINCLAAVSCISYISGSLWRNNFWSFINSQAEWVVQMPLDSEFALVLCTTPKIEKKLKVDATALIFFYFGCKSDKFLEKWLILEQHQSIQKVEIHLGASPGWHEYFWAQNMKWSHLKTPWIRISRKSEFIKFSGSSSECPRMISYTFFDCKYEFPTLKNLIFSHIGIFEMLRTLGTSRYRSQVALHFSGLWFEILTFENPRNLLSVKSGFSKFLGTFKILENQKIFGDVTYAWKCQNEFWWLNESVTILSSCTTDSFQNNELYDQNRILKLH